MSIAEVAPSNQPRLITGRGLDYLKLRFERDVVDPLFFGRIGEDPKVVQAEIDVAVTRLGQFVDRNFHVSNQEGVFNG